MQYTICSDVSLHSVDCSLIRLAARPIVIQAAYTDLTFNIFALKHIPGTEGPPVVDIIAKSFQ